MKTQEKTYDNDKFKLIRLHFKLSQKEFAEKLGTKQQVIAMIENGKRDVPKSIRKNFFDVYGISYDQAVNCKDENELTILLEIKSNPDNGIGEKELYNAFIENILNLNKLYNTNLKFSKEAIKLDDNTTFIPDIALKGQSSDRETIEKLIKEAGERTAKIAEAIREKDSTKEDASKNSSFNEFYEKYRTNQEIEALDHNIKVLKENLSSIENRKNQLTQRDKDVLGELIGLNPNEKDNIIALPLHRIGAAAGAGTWLSDEPDVEKMYFDRRFLQQILRTSNYNTLHLIYATGDSMDSGWNQPDDIKDGDLLMVDTSQTTGNNNIFVIRVNNSELRVKKLFKRNNALFISSNNPKYPEEVYYPDNTDYMVEIIGRVVWHGAKDSI